MRTMLGQMLAIGLFAQGFWSAAHYAPATMGAQIIRIPIITRRPRQILSGQPNQFPEHNIMADSIYEFIVSPDDGTTGQNLIKLLQGLDVHSRLPLAIVADVECNQVRTWVQRPPFASSTQEIINYAATVGQFDWATFFFFAEQPAALPETESFDRLFALAQIIVRAVDDTHFYIYSPDADDGARLSGIFPVESNPKQKNAIVHPF